MMKVDRIKRLYKGYTIILVRDKERPCRWGYHWEGGGQSTLVGDFLRASYASKKQAIYCAESEISNMIAAQKP